VKELKPWVRAVVTGWVLLTVPVLMGNLALLVMQTPRILATARRSFSVQVDVVSSSLRAGSPASLTLGVVSIVALALPVIGTVAIFAQLGHRAGAAALRWSNRARQRSKGKVSLVSHSGRRFR
jgi:putative peptide zinc metalloprotease protein